MKTVLILTRAYDPHVPPVTKAIRARGIDVVCFNLADFPEIVGLHATLDKQQNRWVGSITSHSQHVPLDALISIWWRRPTSYKAPTTYSPGERAFLEEEANRGFIGLLESLVLQQTLWVSRLHSLRRAELKPLQLAAAQQLGLRTPHTMLTNDPDTVRAFYEQCEGQVVLKAVSQGVPPMNEADHLSSSTPDDLAARLRQQLVETLRQSGVLHAPSLQRAFLSVAREVFVPYFYEPETTSHEMAWKRVSANEMEDKAYLTAVYRNKALVTNIDERGWPTSSSSLPAAMARMLEALDVQPGQRILEIGTGSGYNAALLAHLTDSSGRVITIERDAALATTAASTLAQESGPTATVVVGDGVEGWSREAPYDRIIATASLSTLPLAWVKQLRPGGRLIMDMQATLASGFLVVEKTPAGSVSGSFLAEPLHFMPLQMERSPLPSLQTTPPWRQSCQQTFVLEQDAVFPDILFDPAFRWFLQWCLPGCQINTYTQEQPNTASRTKTIVMRVPTRHAWLRFQRSQDEANWQGSVSGEPSLWQELTQAHDMFMHLGAPPVQSYRLVVEQERPFLLIGPLKLPLARV